jgi:CheY-like chemotaxis protein
MILVVDDDLVQRYVTTRWLIAAGYDIREAATGLDALRLAGWKPDLIVLDLHLPDIDGFEVTQRLKAHKATAGIPIVHKTAVYRDPADRERGLRCGASAYFDASEDPREILGAIKRLLEEPPAPSPR